MQICPLNLDFVLTQFERGLFGWETGKAFFNVLCLKSITDSLLWFGDYFSVLFVCLANVYVRKCYLSCAYAPVRTFGNLE